MGSTRKSMPNTEVKTQAAESTVRGTAREGRRLPEHVWKLRERREAFAPVKGGKGAVKNRPATPDKALEAKSLCHSHEVTVQAMQVKFAKQTSDIVALLRCKVP